MTDILVKYQNFPALEIELGQNTAAADYKRLVRDNVRHPAIFRDQVKYTAAHFAELAHRVKVELGWDWVNEDYNNFETTLALHKYIEEYIGGPGGYLNAPAEQHDLLTEIHYCLHAIQHGSTRAQWLQVEWYNDNGFYLPSDFEFAMELKFGDIKLQNPYVGHMPLMIWEQQDNANIMQTCQFHDLARPGINIVIMDYTPRLKGIGTPYNQATYLSWFHEHAPDFMAMHDDATLLRYTGWPIIGRVTNLDVLRAIKVAPLLELESVVVL